MSRRWRDVGKLNTSTPRAAKGDRFVVDMAICGSLLSWRIFTSCLVCMSIVLTSSMLRTNLYDAAQAIDPVDIVKETVIARKASVDVVKEKFIARKPSNVAQSLQAEPLSPKHDNSFLVEDAVSFPESVMLLINTCEGCSLLAEEYYCDFGGNEKTSLISVEKKEPGLRMVRCPHPQKQLHRQQDHQNIPTLRRRKTHVKLPARVHYPGKKWNNLVYEALSLRDSILLFVKGPSFRRIKIRDPNQLACFYGPNVKTRVVVAAQEVVRCERPPLAMEKLLAGEIVTVWDSRQGLLPSVARFHPLSKEMWPSISTGGTAARKHFLCVCSMVWNEAKFLKEWIMYHASLGVERWFLYDNNSDDEIQDVLASLSSYNVSRHVWPWIKTQEAGFSHCAVRAQQECRWVMFIDVDEFVYPKDYLKEPGFLAMAPLSELDNINRSPSVLQRVISNVTDSADFKVGEIRIDCHSFGPSGRTEEPREGVTGGYTCRMQNPERHKSIVKVEALSKNLLNVVHHFQLKSSYRSTDLPRSSVMINHYKYQAWGVFRKKFVRRVATYITDWREKQNETSRDRAPGLGTEAIEPPDWPHRFCEVNDTRLRNWTQSNFQNLQTHRMLWQ